MLTPSMFDRATIKALDFLVRNPDRFTPNHDRAAWTAADIADVMHKMPLRTAPTANKVSGSLRKLIILGFVKQGEPVRKSDLRSSTYEVARYTLAMPREVIDAQLAQQRNA